MKCGRCGAVESKVIDSRPNGENTQIRRRRECEACGHRFTTYELIDEASLAVVKKDGRRESFSPEKVLTGLMRACEKRPISHATLEALVETVRRDLQRRFGKEVPVAEIGEHVLHRLRDIDTIAWVRFLSVYREFQNPEEFIDELLPMLQEKACKK